MSSIRIEQTGEMDELVRRLNGLAGIRAGDITGAIAEGVRTRTMEQFSEEKSPDGEAWKTSVRARTAGGKTLTKTGVLKNSIHARSDDTGMAVGTNDIRAATHQFGDTRTIHPKKGEYLAFQVGGKWVRCRSVRITIPARPFLGINEDDLEDVKDILTSAVEGR